jgi:hypothetical protein
VTSNFYLFSFGLKESFDNRTSIFMLVYCLDYIFGQHTNVLTADNTCPHSPRTEQRRLYSSKHAGFGIDSVCFIAHQYQEETCFEWKDGIFYASVMFKIVNQNSGAKPFSLGALE